MVMIPYSEPFKVLADYVSMKNPLVKFWYDMTGYSQARNTELSTKKQISYNDYIKGGNARALADWNRHVGSKGLPGYHPTIRYPELSYAGAIYRADTGSYRAGLDADTAYSNYYGNLPYRSAGLYGVASRVSRWL